MYCGLWVELDGSSGIYTDLFKLYCFSYQSIRWLYEEGKHMEEGG